LLNVRYFWIATPEDQEIAIAQTVGPLIPSCVALLEKVIGWGIQVEITAFYTTVISKTQRRRLR